MNDGYREWAFDDCLTILDGGTLTVYMYGEEGCRSMDLWTDDLDGIIGSLENGSSPVRDGWDDGHGRKVCYENGDPCDDVPMLTFDFRYEGVRFRMEIPHMPEGRIWNDLWNSIEEHDKVTKDRVSYNLGFDSIVAVGEDACKGPAAYVDSWDEVEDIILARWMEEKKEE